MKYVQCYELFGGIAPKNHAFSFHCAGDIEADHTDSGIVMDCVDRNSETPHLGD